MGKKLIVGFVLLMLGAWAAFSWATTGEDARTVIANATKALGADDLRTLEFSGSGYDFARAGSQSELALAALQRQDLQPRH